jgi:hypothetical protein
MLIIDPTLTRDGTDPTSQWALMLIVDPTLTREGTDRDHEGKRCRPTLNHVAANELETTGEEHNDSTDNT